jgi:hypothetical protein
VILLVAQITPLNPGPPQNTACTECESPVATLNSQIPAWASTDSAAASPVIVVDIHSWSRLLHADFADAPDAQPNHDHGKGDQRQQVRHEIERPGVAQDDAAHDGDHVRGGQQLTDGL